MKCLVKSLCPIYRWLSFDTSNHSKKKMTCIYKKMVYNPSLARKCNNVRMDRGTMG